jgi:putative DNA primase/helicase
VISTPGYDASTGLLLEIGGDWPIPVAPTKAGAVAAWERLKELLRYYPWASDMDRAVALSLLLTAIARPVLPAAPMHCADSPEAGSGKSLLVDAASILARDVPASVMDFGRDPIEAGKRLDAMMLAGDALVAIDNVEIPIEGGTLCQMLTQTARRIRVMGSHTVVTVPCVQMVCATGCNLTLRGDIVRRVVTCRLDAGTDRPELRDIGQDLLAEVREGRRKIVCDLIAVMLAYQRAGHPNVKVPPFGSFGPWSRMVRQALVWIGEADPCLSVDRIRGDDPSRQNLAAVLTAWHAAFGSEAMTVGEVVKEAWDGSALRAALAAVCEKRGVLARHGRPRELASGTPRPEGGGLVLRAGEPDSHSKVARWAVFAGTAGTGGYSSNCRSESVSGGIGEGKKEEESSSRNDTYREELGTPRTHPHPRKQW